MIVIEASLEQVPLVLVLLPPALALAPGDAALGHLDGPLDLRVGRRGLVGHGRGGVRGGREEVLRDGRDGRRVLGARVRLERLRAAERLHVHVHVRGVRAVLRRGCCRGCCCGCGGRGRSRGRDGANGERDGREVVVGDGGRGWRGVKGGRVDGDGRAEVVGGAGAVEGLGGGVVVVGARGRGRRGVERLRVALEKVELAAGRARKGGGDGCSRRGNRRGRRSLSLAEAPRGGEGRRRRRRGKVGCVREASPVVMGGGEEYRGDDEVLEEADGDARVVRLTKIRGQGGDIDGELAWGWRGRARRSEGSYGVVRGAREGAESAFIVIGNAFPLESAWASGELKLAGTGG